MGTEISYSQLNKQLVKTNQAICWAVDDLHQVMEWLREGKHYAESDRLRTIIGRLARAVPKSDEPNLIRTIARGYK